MNASQFGYFSLYQCKIGYKISHVRALIYAVIIEAICIGIEILIEFIVIGNSIIPVGHRYNIRRYRTVSIWLFTGRHILVEIPSFTFHTAFVQLCNAVAVFRRIAETLYINHFVLRTVKTAIFN